MNKKTELCNELAERMEPYQVIRHNYTASRKAELDGGA